MPESTNPPNAGARKPVRTWSASGRSSVRRASGRSAARPRAVAAPQVERTHPLPVPRRAVAPLENHLRKIVRSFCGSARVGIVSASSALAMRTTLRPASNASRAGGASRVASRASACSGALATLGQPIACKASLARPSSGKSAGAGPSSGGATQNSSVLRDSAWPEASRASSVRGRIAIASAEGAGEREHRRFGSQRQTSRRLAKTPCERRAFGDFGCARKAEDDLEPLTRPDRAARRARDHEPRRLKTGKRFSEGARAIAHIHQPIRFPLRVVEFGQHIAADRLFQRRVSI